MEYSQEELNFLRLCFVVFNLIPEGLRQIFKKEWDLRYKTSLDHGEWKDTPTNGKDFYGKESKASQKKNRQNLVIIQNGNTLEWDCTCLFFAILYSDSIGTNLNSAVYEAVDDIRQVRNKAVAHNGKAKLTDDDFKTSVDTVLEAFSTLGLPTSNVQEVANLKNTFPTKEVEELKKQALNLRAELDQTKSDLAAEHVAKALDNQPLAVAAAAEYFAQTVLKNGPSNYDWKAYLQEISKHSQSEETENLSGNEKTKAAVEMTLRRTVETDEVLRQTFSFLAICAQNVLPIEVVLKFVKARVTDQSEELIKAKIMRSPLIVVKSDEGDEKTYVSLPEPVYAALKLDEIIDFKSGESDFNMAEAIGIIYESLLEANDEHALLKNLTTHCKSLLEHMTSNFTSNGCTILERLTPFISLERVFDWLGTLAWVCCEISDMLFAKNVCDVACSLLEEDDSDSSALIKGRIFNISGAVYERLEKYSRAKDLYEKALTIGVKILGVDHPNVARSYNNLANVYYRFGDLKQAKEFHYKALIIKKAVFHEDHAEVAASYNNVALVLNDMEKHYQAKNLHKKALEIQKKNFGYDHADVGGSYNNLAVVYNSLGKYEQAKELHKKALKIRMKIFGEDHADVAQSYDNLASLYKRMGRKKLALELQEKALVIRKKLFGNSVENYLHDWDIIEMAEIVQSTEKNEEKN